MKISNIEIGNFYHDGKQGVRRVVNIFDADGIKKVEYEILSARQEKNYEFMTGNAESIIGNKSNCHIESFASWAKNCIANEDEALLLIAKIEVERTKLSVSEENFLKSIVASCEMIKVGNKVEVNNKFRTAAKTCGKKGFGSLDEDKSMFEIGIKCVAWKMLNQ